ncbi:hypothetical protein H3N56_11105 [Cetobacterium sp. 2A]|uniref:hypothetical protein n=1 Tax=Cetobacterium sp. 2A TaxID=2754723 RepID=UPI00163D2255|nr:hypothetical protein [Cetobacterium sp. 2A]MBC2856980.1 hypothetical protein [Cetobacterium sp. 2A]
MIKDIEYAFFSQLSYLNWNKLDKNDFKFYKSYQDKKLIEFLNLESQVWNKIRTPFYDKEKNLEKV